MQAFKAAVQGQSPHVLTASSQSNLLHCSAEEIAAKLGLPKGLIRTDSSKPSLTQSYASSLFGGDDDNPARRQRLNREKAAQRAVETARAVVAARSAASGGARDAEGNGFGSLLNRFASSGRQG
jgi:hypothetical protein